MEIPYGFSISIRLMDRKPGPSVYILVFVLFQLCDPYSQLRYPDRGMLLGQTEKIGVREIV
jgi:hypothetical protein